MSHDAVVPNSVVVVPIRPYTAAVGAAASSRASRRMVGASMPVAAATASGVNGTSAARTSSRPPRWAATCGPGIGETFVDQHVGDRGQQAARPSRDGSGATRRPPRRCGCAAGRRPRACRRAPGSPRCDPGSRARCTGCRSTRTGWRRARRGSRCGRGREPGRRRANRTRTRPRRGGASGRPSTRCSAAACRAPVSSARVNSIAAEAVRRRVAEVHGERRRARGARSHRRGRARPRPTPRPTPPRRARRRA